MWLVPVSLSQAGNCSLRWTFHNLLLIIWFVLKVCPVTDTRLLINTMSWKDVLFFLLISISRSLFVSWYKHLNVCNWLHTSFPSCPGGGPSFLCGFLHRHLWLPRNLSQQGRPQPLNISNPEVLKERRKKLSLLNLHCCPLASKFYSLVYAFSKVIDYNGSHPINYKTINSSSFKV